jgi:predicted permease
MRSILRDLRHGARRLVRTPTFTIVSILTLALGVGANTAIVSLIEAVLLNPSGVSDPETLASFHTKYTQLNLPSIGVSTPDFLDAQSLHSLVSSAAMSQQGEFNAQIGDRTAHLNSALVSWQWFQTFGAKPILGRGFLPEDDQKGSSQVVVLSYSGWQRLFGGERNAIGKTLTLDDQSYRVVGVMRSDFDWPGSTDVWAPLGLEARAYGAGERFNEFYDSVVRMKPGVTVTQLNAALAQKTAEEIRRNLDNGFAAKAGWSMFAQPWTTDAAGSLRKPLLALFAAAFSVLLIACANISGLMLVRAGQRSRDFAIQTALGASATEIAAQLASEVPIIAGAATLIGLISGPIFGRLLLLIIPRDLAQGFSVHANLSLLLGAAGLGLVASLLSGFAPVIRVVHQQTSLRLAEYSRGLTSTAGRQRAKEILVAGQVALAFTLLAGTGMFLSSLRELEKVDPGFRASGVLTGYVSLSSPVYRDSDERKRVFVNDVLSRLSQNHGVAATAAVFPLPFGSTISPSGSFDIEDMPSAGGDAGPHADKRWATPGYLSAMKVPLLRGRWFIDSDRPGSQPVAVIDDVLASAYWPNRDPIGQRLRFGSHQDWALIVGVIGHVRRDSLEVDENKGVVYRPFAQNPTGDVAFVVRTDFAPDAMRDALSAAVHAADSSEALYNTRTLEDLVSQSLTSRQLLVWLLSAFGSIALLLAAIGIYGLLSHSVSERTAEIGIRMALGADRTQVVLLILKSTLTWIGTGLLVGFVLSALGQKTLAHVFAAMGAGLLHSLAIATLILLGAAAMAALIPALRSASVDPVIAIRQE